MNKLLIISGPTASGKTKLALELAKQFNGELISIDSRQVYKGMDVVTGKDINNSKFQISNFKLKINKPLFSVKRVSPDISGREILVGNPQGFQPTSFHQREFNFGFYDIDGIKLWGLDIVEPDQEFDVSHYIAYAQAVLENIWKKGKLPIVVGGTGFWVRSLLKQPETVGVPVDHKLRKELEGLEIQALQKKLQEADCEKWEGMNNSDRHNPRRLIRAIEVSRYKNTQLFPATSYQLPATNNLWIGLSLPIDELRSKICERVSQRINSGAVEETKRLAFRYGWDIPSMTGIGYADLRLYIENGLSLDQVIDNWVLHEVQYAKRQMTWFKKEQRINWYDVQDEQVFAKIKHKVDKYIYRG